MASNGARVRFELESRAENVALVRSGLSALGEVLEIGDELSTDLRTAVSEACNNVVVHAYGEASGSLVVTVDATDSVIEVIVCDEGCGIRQITTHADHHMGLGMGVMSALADRLEFITPRHGGTEVRLCFRRSERDVSDSEMGELGQWLPSVPMALSGDAVVWLEPVALLGPVFGRVLRAYAAGYRFSADRVDGLRQVTDALASYAGAASAGAAVGIAITGSAKRLDLISGPFPHGTAEHARSDRGLALADLVDGFTVGQVEGQSTVRFAVTG